MVNTQRNNGLSYESIIRVSAVLLVLLPLATLLLVSVYLSSNALVNVIKKEMEDQSILIGLSINSFIDERILDARTISQADVLEQDDINKKIQYLTEITLENQRISDIDIINLKGRIVASSGAQNEKGMLLWEQHSHYESLFQKALKASQGQVFVSEPTTIDSGPGILILTPITDDTNKKTTSFLALEVSLDHITKIFSSVKNQLHDLRYLYIVDNNGRVIGSNNPAISFLSPLPDLQVQPSLINALSKQDATGNFTYTDTNNINVIAVYSDLGEFGINKSLDWSVIIIEPIDIIVAPATYLRNLLLILGSIIVFMAIFLAYKFSIVFSNTLDKFATRAKSIAEGNFSTGPVNIVNRKGALRTLNDAFNKMENDLKDLIHELKDREQRLKITLNSIGDGVIATDKFGCITRMNPISEKMTGWMLKDAKGKLINDIFPIVDETSRQAIKNPIEKVLETGQTVYLSNHTTLISKDGSEYQIEDSAAPIYDDNNNIHGMILIFSDVTRRKQAEERYRQSSKMDALGKLTGGIAHDYNNMLGVVMGYTELLSEFLVDQPKLTKYLNTIQQSAERGSILTQKLLKFSRQKTTNPKTVNLNELLIEQEFMLQKTLTTRISLVYELEDNVWPVFVDESDFIDAILNISINALHAMEGTGGLTIATRNQNIDENDSKNNDIKAGDYVLLSITDTGCGMDKNTLEKVFEPFFSTKGEKGTGLGLSQVYGFIQRSNGYVKIYSEPGKGSQFNLYFLRSNEVLSEQDSQATDHALNDFIASKHSEKILIVDDEAELASLLSHILTKNGFTTLSAISAKDALTILENEHIDILLSDLIMPEIDGYELATIVMQRYPHIKIQLTSGFADDRNVNKFCIPLQKKILKKPYTNKEVLQCIRDLIE